FSPTILFFTEHFKSFNHVFWLSAIFSNCQAPSHNTCHIFAQQDDVKHITTGSY
ncbi:hypothetical protein HD554DRAFT_2029491, partial [Boletus coccyginus]